MMVLPLSAALGRSIRPWRSRAHARRLLVGRIPPVTLPLSVPGFASARQLVFSLTAKLVRNARAAAATSPSVGTLVEEQILTVFDWPFGAAIATAHRAGHDRQPRLGLAVDALPSRGRDVNLMSEGGLGKSALRFIRSSGDQLSCWCRCCSRSRCRSPIRIRRVPAAGLTLQWYWKVFNEPTSPRRSCQRAARPVLGIGALILGTPPPMTGAL